MPRINRTQKEAETLVIREFIQHLGFAISNPKWQERPDALVTIRNSGKRQRIAIEHTDHYGDTIARRCSPLTPIEGFWSLVQASLVRRLSHRKHLTGVLGCVRFRNAGLFATGRSKDGKNLIAARQLATEVIAFVESHPICKESAFRVFRRPQFGGYPQMESMLDFLRVSRATDERLRASRCSWSCSNITTGNAALSLKYVKSAIEAENAKALTFENWGDAVQRWLLIVCGGGHVSSNAAPFDRYLKCDDAALGSLCQQSPFDRIVIWDRVHLWHKWLKPLARGCR